MASTMVAAPDARPDVLPTERLLPNGIARPDLRPAFRRIDNLRNAWTVTSLWLVSSPSSARVCGGTTHSVTWRRSS